MTILLGGAVDPMFRLRTPCAACKTSEGRVEPKNGQDCVYCNACGKFQYNAPRVETGREVRSTSTVHALVKPKQRARILTRANGCCELCRRNIADGDHFDVGHLLSVADGLRHGITELELNDDNNLAAMCDQCNRGLGEETIPLWLAAAILMRRTRG